MTRGVIREFEDFDDIPQDIDAVISFKPDYPPPPHTEEDHRVIEEFMPALDDLMRRTRRKR